MELSSFCPWTAVPPGLGLWGPGHAARQRQLPPTLLYGAILAHRVMSLNHYCLHFSNQARRPINTPSQPRQHDHSREGVECHREDSLTPRPS